MPENNIPIITVEDKQGNQFFPVTHVNAVIDSNGSPVSTLLSEKQPALISGTNIKTINNQSILGSGNLDVASSGGGMIQGTWATIKAYRDNGTLVPGTWYRITDYVATIPSGHRSGAISANKPFDIIVLATSENTFSEEAKAAINENDNYFSLSDSYSTGALPQNLDAWKVWYCIDNDDVRFDWADQINGKGVIYRLIDEYNNDCPYDFKGICFSKSITWFQMAPSSPFSSWLGSVGYFDSSSCNFFTFSISFYDSPMQYDASVIYQVGYNPYDHRGVHDNYIAPTYDYDNAEFCPRRQMLLCNLFIENNSTGRRVNDMLVTPGFQYNSIKEDSFNNCFAKGCHHIEIASNCYDNYFYEFSEHIELGDSCCYNVFGHTIGEIYGQSCKHIKLGSYNTSNGFSGCTNVVYGDYNDHVRIPVMSSFVTVGNNNSYLFFNWDNSPIDTGSSAIIIEDDIHYVNLTGIGSYASSDLKIRSGISGTSQYPFTLSYSVHGYPTELVDRGRSMGFGFIRLGDEGLAMPGDIEPNMVYVSGKTTSATPQFRHLIGSDLPAVYRSLYLPEEKRPLTFEILTSGTITWKHVGSSKLIWYSKNGSDWTPLNSSTSGKSISVSAGDTLVFYGSDNWPGISSGTYRTFGGTATFNAYGNPASLRYGFNLTGNESLSDYCYYRLFYNCTGIRRGPIIIGNNTASAMCADMFYGCTGLTSVTCDGSGLGTTTYQGWLTGCDFVIVTVLSDYTNFIVSNNSVPKGCIEKTSTGCMYISSSVDWRTFNTKTSGGTQYTTKADAVNASGLTEAMFNTLLQGKYVNASLKFGSDNGRDLLIASPIGYRTLYHGAPIGNYDREVYWINNEVVYGIYYDCTTGYYYLYGATIVPT